MNFIITDKQCTQAYKIISFAQSLSKIVVAVPLQMGGTNSAEGKAEPVMLGMLRRSQPAATPLTNHDIARQRVIALIQQDEEFTTFRASCNWPDRPRQRASEHFVNLPRDANGLDGDECPLADKCVVRAIEEDFAVLASSDATEEEKLAALKFLGHWVGDIHQPLHAGFRDDRGGNHVRTQGSPCRSLHTVWGSCIVEERLGMDPLTIVTELRAGITDEQRAHWLASDAVAWANESLAIVRSRDLGYCVTSGAACQYDTDNPELDDGEPKKVVVVDDAYLDIHAPVVRERIAMAGVRLAGLLNRALGYHSFGTSLRA